MATRKYSVPFITHTTEIFEVEATSPADAAMKATTLRLEGNSPTHHHVTSFKIGTVKGTLPDDSEVL